MSHKTRGFVASMAVVAALGVGSAGVVAYLHTAAIADEQTHPAAPQPATVTGGAANAAAHAGAHADAKTTATPAPASAQPQTLNDVAQLALSADGSKVELPSLPGKVQIVGSSLPGVIDTNGVVYKPLTMQTVELKLEHVVNGTTETKIFRLSVDGTYKDEGVGARPKVVPVVQQWHGTDGTSDITSSTTLVDTSGVFVQARDRYKKDLAARGVTVQVATAVSSNSVVFKKVANKGYGNEGYGITIANGCITIEAETNLGAFYATRTLLQMGENKLQNGEIRDFFTYPVRNAMLDTGRKFIPYEQVLNVLEQMAYYKMNDLQLHMNDNFIFLKDHIADKQGMSQEEKRNYVLTHALCGFRLPSKIQGSDGTKLTSADHYTTEQMQHIIAYAKELGINIVPEIDTPGHALSFVKVRPDLMYQGTINGKDDVERVAMLDLSKNYDKTLTFVKSVYDELLSGPLKGINTIHIGTDEYYGSTEDYRRYVNDLVTYIKSKGLTPRVWGSLDAKKGTHPVDFKNVQACIWSLGWQGPQSAIEQGAKVINIIDNPTYTVPSGNGSQGAYGDFVNTKDMYERWAPGNFSIRGGKVYSAAESNIVGGGFAIWNDNCDLRETGITSYDILKRFMHVLPIAATRNAASAANPKTLAELPKLSLDKIYAPGTNPEHALDASKLPVLDLAHLDVSAAHHLSRRGNFLHFEKSSDVTSSVSTGVDAVGVDHSVTVRMKLNGDKKTAGEQVLFENADTGAKFYLRDKDGRIAYDFEHVHLQFDKKLPFNKMFELTITTSNQRTRVFVNGSEVKPLPIEKYPRLNCSTFIMPLKTIGGFSGDMYDFVCTEAEKPQTDLYSKITTSSEEPTRGLPNEGPARLAFDGNPQTYWHTAWGGAQKGKTYTIEAELKEPFLAGALTYTSRPGGGDGTENGVIQTLTVEGLHDGTWVKLGTGSFEGKHGEYTITFKQPQTITKLRLSAVGNNGYASAAEFRLMKPKSEDADKLSLTQLEHIWQKGSTITPIATKDDTKVDPSLEKEDEKPAPIDTTKEQNEKAQKANTTTVANAIEEHFVSLIGKGERSVLFNSNWNVTKQDTEANATKPAEGTAWENTNLPHDFSISQPFTTQGEAESGFLLGGTRWYQKTLVVPKELKDKRFRLDFDGVYMNADVWVNGKKLGSHPYGYTAFSFDITDALKRDGKTQNIIAVRVNHKTPSSRWYSGSGIYRDVHLTVTNDVHVSYEGTTIRTPQLESTHDATTTMKITTPVYNAGAKDATVTVKHELIDADGTCVATSANPSAIQVAKGTCAQDTSELSVEKPHLWSVDDPYLYKVKTTILAADGSVLDTYEEDYGFRWFGFDRETGFSLNGTKMKLQGVSMHHDQGALGSAAEPTAIERQVRMLKDMGVNAIRVTHNPAAKTLINIANRLGMMLIDEAFDGWTYSKNGNSEDYTKYLKQPIGTGNAILGGKPDMPWGEFDAHAMVRSALNAPSVIMWSIGNEINEGLTGSDHAKALQEYPAVGKQIISWIRALDDTRPVTMGDNRDGENDAIDDEISDAGGVVGKNYRTPQRFEEARRNHPSWKMYGSETASAIHSRGVYSTFGKDNENLQMSAYDNDTARVGWGASASESWSRVIKNDYNAGEFVWTGFDYIGEPTPWNGVGQGSVTGKGPRPNSSYFGIIDTAGMPKDTYYFYRAMWNGTSDTLHVVPGTWNANELARDAQGKATVEVFTTAAKVELYLNNKKVAESRATFKKTPAGYTYPVFDNGLLYPTFKVPYQSGTLSVRGYDKDGKEITKSAVGTKEVTTHDDASTLAIKQDEITAHAQANGRDLLYFEISVRDDDGNLVTDANNDVTLAVQGGTLVGVDNGNPTDTDSFKANHSAAFNGKLVAIVRPSAQAGKVSLTASAEGLQSATSTATTVAPAASAATEDYIRSYDLAAHLYVEQYGYLQLPKNLLVNWASGKQDLQPLTWKNVDPKLTSKKGVYTLSATLPNGSTVQTQVHVVGQALAAVNIAMVSREGETPHLPTRAKVVSVDGVSENDFPVVWDTAHKTPIAADAAGSAQTDAASVAGAGTGAGAGANAGANAGADKTGASASPNHKREKRSLSAMQDRSTDTQESSAAAPENAASNIHGTVYKGTVYAFGRELPIEARVRELDIPKQETISSASYSDAPTFTNGYQHADGSIEDKGTTPIGDNLTKLNNGTFANGDDTSERWTNWGLLKENPPVWTYVQLNWNKAHPIRNLKLWHFVDNVFAAIPGNENVKFQYWDEQASAWKDIKHTNITQENYQKDGTPYSFEHAVTTTKLRIWERAPEAGKCVGFTEIEAYNDVPLLSEFAAKDCDATLASGSTQLLFTQFNKGMYTLNTTNAVALTTKFGSKNAGITMVKVSDDESLCVISSEDGKTTTTYRVVNKKFDPNKRPSLPPVKPQEEQPAPTPQPPAPEPEPAPEPGEQGETQEGGVSSSWDASDIAEAEAAHATTAMYRLYNKWSGEHLFTTDKAEYDSLVAAGWTGEGEIDSVATKQGKGVYRLYNPYTHEHHYTTDENELAKCVKAGWVNEGIKFHSVQNGTVPVYSMYNPYAKKYYHHYTSDPDEIAKMVKDGWRKEEIKWYAAK